MKRKPKFQFPDGSAAFRMGGQGLQISLNFTPTKEKSGWTEIPAAKPATPVIFDLAEILSSPGVPCELPPVEPLPDGQK